MNNRYEWKTVVLAMVGLFLACCCVNCFAEDAFKKIDPDCDVWIANRKRTATVFVPEFVTLVRVRGLGEPREVWPYFPQVIDREETLAAIPDEKTRQEYLETSDRILEEKITAVDEWTPFKPVPRFDSDNFSAPTKPGYYWCHVLVDFDLVKNDQEMLRLTRILVLVVQKKNGSLGAMRAGSSRVAPLAEFVRWSRGLSIKSITGVNAQNESSVRRVPVSSLPPGLLKNLERARKGEPQKEEP